MQFERICNWWKTTLFPKMKILFMKKIFTTLGEASGQPSNGTQKKDLQTGYLTVDQRGRLCKKSKQNPNWNQEKVVTWAESEFGLARLARRRLPGHIKASLGA
jgi:hypothetical protein